MKRHYYSASIAEFLAASRTDILGTIVSNSGFAIELTENAAWREEIRILQEVLPNVDGQIYFEYTIPRMGRRIDVVLVIGAVLFSSLRLVGTLSPLTLSTKPMITRSI